MDTLGIEEPSRVVISSSALKPFKIDRYTDGGSVRGSSSARV